MQASRFGLSLAAIAGLTCGLGGSIGNLPASAESNPAPAQRIVAVWRVDLAGFNLGDFRLTTTFRGDDYEMRGEGRFTILNGLLYDWTGSTLSTGKVSGPHPEPSSYALSYSGGNKTGQLRMVFDGGAVTGVTTIPQKRPSPRTIPVTREQLEGVQDPMSGAFLYAHSDKATADPAVCRQTVPVFDGEARFDLVLSLKRMATVQRQTPTGYAGPAAVCKVKFIPISGYQPENPGIRLMTETNDIEVWLVPLGRTGMYVPYRIVMPTLVGFGTATSTSFEVDGARRASLAH